MTYTEVIAKVLEVDIATAAKIQNFVNYFFDFRWSGSFKSEICNVAREAYAMMQDPKYSKMVQMMETNA